MLGDPTATTHTDGGDLAVVQPQAGESGLTLTLQPQLLKDIEHNLLQLTQIPVQVRLMPAQVEHGVHHQLTREMMRDFAATVDAMQRSRRTGWVEMQVRCAGTTAQGVTGRVLEKPHGLRSLCILQKPFLPPFLVMPGLLEGHRSGWLEKNCGVEVCQIASRT